LRAAAAARYEHGLEVSMALAPELKEILACPKCKGDLEFHEDRGEIHCTRCRLAYEIRDGIPVMLVEEAKPLP
jgi:uncharacterized protein YbaR (Trm112 family)